MVGLTAVAKVVRVGRSVMVVGCAGIVTVDGVPVTTGLVGSAREVEDEEEDVEVEELVVVGADASSVDGDELGVVSTAGVVGTGSTMGVVVGDCSVVCGWEV